ncbi:unnamed protein product [Paramecium primaurelia]|uniref:Uncharacterized protein n=1 Tax=Paramecium primaurelia TaxID=5886 RepID=A0A8S1KKZ0_PARPR|nr:unnamed protein product [Paramecium primaurelia]
MDCKEHCATFLKFKIQEQKPNRNITDQNQSISQIKVIKQHFLNQQNEINNIEQLQKATSNLYYAMYQIKEKKNIYMIPFTQLKFDKSDWLIMAIINLIEEKNKIIDELGETEKNKYENAIKWTKKIIDSYEEFDDFYIQILEVSKQLKKPQLNEQFSNLLVLQQNLNVNKFLKTFCFIQNIKLDLNQYPEVSQFSQEIDEKMNQNQYQFDNSLKRNLYFNFTSDIEQIDIDFWTFYMSDYKETNKLIILYPIIQNKQEKQLKNNTRNELIIPIIYNNSVQEYQMKLIYKSQLEQQIKNFKPDYIYFEYQISDQFTLDLNALEYLIRQLQKSAKFIIHFRISQNQDFSEYQLSTNLNAIVMGLQGLKYSEKKFISENQFKEMGIWTTEMMRLKENSNKNINLSLQSELQLIQIQIQNIQNKIFGFKQERNEFIWIQEDNININTQHFVYKDTIILYNKLNRDIYYYSLKPSVKNIQNLPQKIEFTKINLGNQQNPVEPSIIKIQNYLIFAYGHNKNNNNNDLEFSDKIWLYDLQNNQQLPIIISRDEEYDEFRLPYYNKVRNSQDIVNRIKWRRAPQICKNIMFNDDNQNFLSFILIGGETLKQKQVQQSNSNSIMNIIEVVILNLKNQKFCSFIVNKSLLSRLSSLKPWPYQTVLDAKLENTYFYLVLNGNQTTKQDYYSFPKNPQYLKQVQLLVQSEKTFQLFILSLKPSQDPIFQLDELVDDCKLQYYVEQKKENNCFVWKLIITRFVLISNQLINHRLFRPLEDKLKKMQKQSIHFCQICFQVNVKLNLQVQEQSTQSYQESYVEIDYEKIELLQNNI